MQSTLYADLTTHTLSERLGGGAFTFPPFVQGDAATIALRFTEKREGVTREVSRTINALRAGIGLVDARPTGGSFTLTFTVSAVASTTDTLPFNASAGAVQAAVRALGGSYADAVVELVDASYLIRFPSIAGQVACVVGTNLLRPLSFVRALAFQRGGSWVLDVRLTQAPVAFTSSVARVVPPAPTIASIQAGGSSGDVEWNAIQALTVPASFRGAYQIRMGSAKSALLSVDDGTDEIAAALLPLAEEGGEFLVTNPVTGVVHIEFSGTMGGGAQDLLEVEVFSAPEGDATFTLNLNTSELAEHLRSAARVVMPLEISVDLEDVNDSEIIHSVTLFRGDVAVIRELASVGMAAVSHIDWERPPQPASYVPFTPDQIITGVQHYTTTIGDGDAESFTVDHDLDTESLHVTVRLNDTPGAVLVHGTDYTVTIDSANALTITPTGDVLSVAEWALVISTAGPVSAFQAHTHTIAQVVGLQTIMDELGGRVEELEGLTGIGALTASTSASSAAVVASWTLPPIAEVYPVQGGAAPTVKSAAEYLAAPLTIPRIGGLMPAVHDATLEDLPTTLPTPGSGNAGKVYEVQVATVLPGYKNRKSRRVAVDAFVASDGRALYEVVQYGEDTETSYYPADFERVLWEIAVNAKQLRLGKTLAVNFGLELAILASTTKAHWSLVIEVGNATQDTTPSTPGLNLAGVVWEAEPILEQRLIITPVPSVHTFGVSITRSLVSSVDTLTTKRVLYGAQEASSVTPASANFSLRARLIRFDTENQISDPRGLVSIFGPNPGVITDGGLATIK